MPVANVNKVKQRKEWDDELRNTNHSRNGQPGGGGMSVSSSSNHGPSTSSTTTGTTTTTASPKRGGRKPRMSNNNPPPVYNESPTTTTTSPSSPRRRSPKRMVSPTWKSPYQMNGGMVQNNGTGGGNGGIAPPPFGGGASLSSSSGGGGGGGGLGSSIHTNNDPLSTTSGSLGGGGSRKRQPVPQFPDWESAMSMDMEELSPTPTTTTRGANGGLHHSMPPLHENRSSPKRPQQQQREKLGGSMPIRSPTTKQRLKSKSPTTRSPKKKASIQQQQRDNKSPIMGGTRHSAGPDLESQSSPKPKSPKRNNKKSSIQREKSPLRHSAPAAAQSPATKSPKVKKKLSVQKSPATTTKSAAAAPPPPQSPTRSPKKKLSVQQQQQQKSSSPKSSPKKKVTIQSPKPSPNSPTSSNKKKKSVFAGDGSSIPGPPLESSSSSPVPITRKETVINGKKVIIQQVPVRSKSEAELLQRRPSALREKMKNMKAVGYFKSQIQIEERPPKTLIIIWIIMAVELAFDLTTTTIAFKAFLDVEKCCGADIELGPIPLSSTIPFLLLVLAELAFMLRAVQLTLWPSLEHTPLDESEEHTLGRRIFSAMICCLKWNARQLMHVVELATVINPFLSCIVAWMLMYGSDKTEAFTVLVLEGLGIVLHIISVILEGEYDTKGKIVWHFIIPFIPFIISVSLCLIYLKEGGVCYLVEKKVFLFTGCEVCEDTGFPPIDGQCGNVTVGGNLLDTLVGAQAASDLTGRDNQDTYCYEKGDPIIFTNSNFCWFPYD